MLKRAFFLFFLPVTALAQAQVDYRAKGFHLGYEGGTQASDAFRISTHIPGERRHEEDYRRYHDKGATLGASYQQQRVRPSGPLTVLYGASALAEGRSGSEEKETIVRGYTLLDAGGALDKSSFRDTEPGSYRGYRASLEANAGLALDVTGDRSPIEPYVMVRARGGASEQTGESPNGPTALNYGGAGEAGATARLGSGQIGAGAFVDRERTTRPSEDIQFVGRTRGARLWYMSNRLVANVSCRTGHQDLSLLGHSDQANALKFRQCAAAGSTSFKPHIQPEEHGRVIGSVLAATRRILGNRPELGADASVSVGDMSASMDLGAQIVERREIQSPQFAVRFRVLPGGSRSGETR